MVNGKMKMDSSSKSHEKGESKSMKKKEAKSGKKS
jgi:hypothetical protein